jgi:amidase
MARTVEDCALLMNAIAGADPLDAATVAPSVPRKFDFTRDLGRKDIKGVRLGVLRQYNGRSEKAEAVIEAAYRELRALGAEVVDVEIPTIGKFESFEVEVMFHEFKAGINEWLLKYTPTGPHKTLEDLIRFNAQNADRMMPFFGQDAFIKAQQRGPLNSPVYRNAIAQCRLLTREQGIDAAIRKHNVTAFVALTAPPAWLLDPITGDYARGGCTSLPAVSGYPHVTVPAGFTRELPVGLSFIGPAFSDAMLFGLAQVYEAATKHRQPPRFLATIP